MGAVGAPSVASPALSEPTRILLEDVLRALADIDVPLMSVAAVTGTGLPDGDPFDPDRFRDEARILDWGGGDRHPAGGPSCRRRVRPRHR